MIVGLDPGITTGIAILDVNGNVLDIYSKRDTTKSDTIKHILRFGTPVVISSDVSTVPKSVEKIATKLECIVYSPDISPTLNEKRELTKEYYHSLKNDHEVDALSAAIKAWKYHRTLFSRVNEKLERFERQEIFANVILKILKEDGVNIEDAIREFIEKENHSVVIEKISKEENNQKDFIGKLQKKLTEKQQEIVSLRDQNILLSKALNDARKELRGLKESKPENLQTKDYQELENSFDYFKKLRRIESKGYYPVIEFEKIDGDLLEEANEGIDLDNRIILVGDKENLNLLNNRNIKCVVSLNEVDPGIENLEFPVVQIDKDAIENFDDIKAIKIDYIEKRLVGAKKSGLVGWLKGYRKRRD